MNAYVYGKRRELNGFFLSNRAVSRIMASQYGDAVIAALFFEK
jgi:hypothetical protein